MKNFFYIFLLITFLITTGCVTEKSSSTPIYTETQQIAYSSVPITAIPINTLVGIFDHDSYQTYNNNEFNFAIQYPKSWSVTGNDVTNTATGKKYKITFSDPTSKSSQYIRVSTGSAGISVDDWESVFLSQLKAGSTQIVGQYLLQLDGHSARKMVLTYGSGTDETESTIIMAIKGDNAFFMEFTTTKDQYSIYSPEYDRMIATFKFS